jgi:hypothetical protein
MHSTIHGTKKIYHPLVIFFYYTNMLSAEQLALLPKTTTDYWKQKKYENLYGYEWVSEFQSNYTNFNEIQKHKIIFKSARLCCRVLNTLIIICGSIKGYKRIFANHSAIIISTIDYLATHIGQIRACTLFNITTNKYYRTKNKVHCSASVLNLCYKTHPHQLTIAENTIIKEAVNAPENFPPATARLCLVDIKNYVPQARRLR